MTTTTKPTESVDLNKNGIIALANSSGIDTDTYGDIWGSTNGAIFKFADALITLARRAPAQQEADERVLFEAFLQADRIYHRTMKDRLWATWQAARATQPVGQAEKCSLRLCCRADDHAKGCNTYDPDRYPDTSAAQAVEPAGQRAVGDDVALELCRRWKERALKAEAALEASAGQAAAGPVAFMYQDDQDRDEPGTGSCVVSKARCRFYRNETPLYAAPVAATPKPAALQEKP